MLGVLAVYSGKERPAGACEIYRGNQPLVFLEQNGGWNTGWVYFETLWLDFQKRGGAAIRQLLTDYDLFIFPRMFIPMDKQDEQRLALAQFFTILHMAGKRIVYETDDDYTNLHRKVVDGDALTPAAWSDAITVTTSYLAETMRRYVKRPVYVLPNCVDPNAWRKDDPPVRRSDMQGKLVIGLTGSPTHEFDWRVLADVLPQVLSENPGTHLLLMGYQPPYLENIPNVSFWPARSYDQYSQVIRTCDIILAPVNPTDLFNMGKSPIKAVEGLAAARTLESGSQGGAAVIATNNPIYSIALQNEKTGLLVDHSPEAWKQALTRVIRDNNLRERLQTRGFAWVYNHYDASKEWRRWAMAYTKILSAPPNQIAMN